MFTEPVTVPTDTLLDIIFVMLADVASLTSGDISKLEQIQRELQRRGVENLGCPPVASGTA